MRAVALIRYCGMIGRAVSNASETHTSVHTAPVCRSFSLRLAAFLHGWNIVPVDRFCFIGLLSIVIDDDTHDNTATPIISTTSTQRLFVDATVHFVLSLGGTRTYAQRE